jgi:hypothetical protein
MIFKVFTNSAPVLVGCHQDIQGVCLVFDCVCEQYRRVVHYIDTEWDKVTPLYRLVIPNTQDWSHYELAHPNDHMRHYQGCFDQWPDATFDIARIVIDDDHHHHDVDDDNAMEEEGEEDITTATIRPYEHTLSGFRRDAYETEKKYTDPHVLTGYSIIQMRAMERLATVDFTWSFPALCYQLHLEFRLPLTMCEQQLVYLCMGNLPRAIRRGKAIVRMDDLRKIPFSVIPELLVNGPYPIDMDMLHSLLIRIANSAIAIPDLPSAFLQGIDQWPPCCEGFDFVQQYGQWFTTKPAMYRASVTNKQQDASLVLVKPHFVCRDDKWNVISFSSVEAYLLYWIKASLTQRHRERPERVQFKEDQRTLLFKIHQNDTRSYQTEEGRTYSRRIFTEFTLEEKRVYLSEKFKTPALIEEVLHTPLYMLGPECIQDEDFEGSDITDFKIWTARGEWLEFLRKIPTRWKDVVPSREL